MSNTVEDWLRSLGLIQYTQAFLDNGYDELDICKEMGEEDLDAIGVKNIKDRIDILSAVNRLKQSGTAVYFVLEEGAQPPPISQTREKILPLKLKMFLHDTLEENNIKLSDPPYTIQVSCIAKRSFYITSRSICSSLIYPSIPCHLRITHNSNSL